MAITITHEFEDALNRINSGQNVLITGKAGTGKSTLLRTFLEGTTNQQILVTAPTGVAALNVGGFTIHKAFGFRPGMYPDDIKSGGSWWASSNTAKIMQSLDILVIDEISMVRADLFDMMNLALQRLRKNNRPFGGVQLVLVGDLLQLPPVVTEQESKIFTENWDSPYFFSAHCYDQVALNSINLTTVWRQSDEEFIEILNQVREGSLSDAALSRLNQQVDSDFEAPNDWVTLASRRKGVDKINHARLAALDTTKFLSVAERFGEADTNSFSASEELHYAVGARVMTVINDPMNRFVNGSFGTITKATNDTITVNLDHSGETVELEKHVWEIKRPTVTDSGLGSEAIGSVRQFPVILAWAITIHKSQGKTIPKLFINLAGGTATDGQFYVALSRGVSLDNLRFSAPVEPRHVRANNSLVRRIRRDVGPAVTTNRITFLSIDGVNFGISDHVARIHAVILDNDRKVAEFGTWINPMSDLGSFGESHNVPSGGLAMAPTLSDFWPLLLRQAEGRIIVGDNLPMLERAIRHQEKGMDLALGTGYDVSEFNVSLTGSDVIERCHAMVSAYQQKPFPISHGQVVPPASQEAEGSVFIPSWAPTSPMDLDKTHATDSDHAWAAFSGGPTHNLVDEEVAETADLLSAWAVSRGYWTEAEEADIRARAARAGMTDLILPEVESNNLDVPSLLTPGTRIAFTGRNNLLGGPADDDRLKEICESVNLEYKKGVSKSRCDVLVAHDPASQSRKAQNAREYGKPIISQDDFEHWYYNGPFLAEPAEASEQVEATKAPETSPTPATAPTPPPVVEEQTVNDEPETEVFEYVWAKPEDILTPGTRVSFRGSTYVDGVLLPQGEPLQGLCSLLGIEYKQAVTKTRCDVLVTDDPSATDGKMKMAKMHNKPLIRQADFDVWAKQKLAELEYEDALDSTIDEEVEDEPITHEPVKESGAEPKPVETQTRLDEVLDQPTPPSEASKPTLISSGLPRENANTVSYGDYLATSTPQKPAAVQKAHSSEVEPMRPKLKKALIGAGVSAAASVTLFLITCVLIIMQYSDDVAIPIFALSIVAGLATVVFGIMALINWILKK
ncbi:AAA family ATPase [Corynebacterium sp. L4756]|uniref:AAA family ATPase n=1 Tax=unclassified Corynebacterium TaxID=2624378 RepID=UPI00374CD1C1